MRAIVATTLAIALVGIFAVPALIILAIIVLAISRN